MPGIQRIRRRSGRRRALVTAVLAVAAITVTDVATHPTGVRSAGSTGPIASAAAAQSAPDTPAAASGPAPVSAAAHPGDALLEAPTPTVASALAPAAPLSIGSPVSANHERKAKYVLVSTDLTKQGYGEGTPDLLSYLADNAQLVYRAHSSASGSLLFYDVRALTKANR